MEWKNPPPQKKRENLNDLVWLSMLVGLIISEHIYLFEIDTGATVWYRLWGVWGGRGSRF